MADAPVVHIGENSREEVAYKLMLRIFKEEKDAKKDRASILDLYAECLSAASGHRNFPKK